MSNDDSDTSLTRLAHAAGIELEYDGYRGERVRVSTQSLLATLRVLGIEIESESAAAEHLHAREREHTAELAPPCVVVWGDAPLEVSTRFSSNAHVHVRLRSSEPGEAKSELVDTDVSVEADGTLRLPGSIAAGYYQLDLEGDSGRASVQVISAPEQAWAPPGQRSRSWGLFAPLYALRGAAGGTGTLSDLGRLGELAGSAGGSVVGTLPLLAGFLDEPLEISPYGPASRLFWNELYLDLAPYCDGAGGPAATTPGDELVDYRAEMARVRACLSPAAVKAWARESDALEEFAATHVQANDYARFRAVGERQGTFFDCWPVAAAAGSIVPSDFDESARRYHVFVQREMERQLGALAQRTELYLDLPIGVHRWSFDVWREREAFAIGASAGAPPDALFSGGQNWGAPPINPLAARRSGHRYFASAVRTHMRHASMLRVDHVIGMHRLYWVPDGAAATDGCYVRYPADELYAVLCLESHRNQCAVAGEDLGTVPTELRPMLARRGMHRLHVGQFSVPDWDGGHIEEPTLDVVASLNTHDTPTFAGFWQGREIDERVEMGLIDQERAGDEHASRERQRRVALAQFGDGGYADPRTHVMRNWSLSLGRSEAQLVLLTLEDLWLEARPQNVPGTGPERPNWRRRMTRTLADIEADGDIRQFLSHMGETRSRSDE